MSPLENETAVPPTRVRTMQILHFALMMGLGCAIGIGFVMPSHPRGDQQPMLTYVAGAALLVNLPLSVLLPMILTQNRLQQLASQPANPAEDTAILLAFQQTTRIVSAALLEGAGMIASVAFQIEHETLALGLAVGAILVLLLQFPTAGNVQALLEQQRQRLEELRQQRS